MDMIGLHPGLQIRVALLRERIGDLKARLDRESGIEKIDDRIEIEHLERRYRLFRERLQELELEGDGFRAAFKSGVAQVAYDLASSLGDFVKRLDSNYRASFVRKSL